MKILYTKTHPTYYTHTSRYPRSTTGPSSPSFSCLSTGASSVGSLVCVFDLFAYSMSRCCFPTRAFSDVAHRADAVRFMRLSVSRPVVGAFWWRFSQRELPRPNVCTSARNPIGPHVQTPAVATVRRRSFASSPMCQTCRTTDSLSSSTSRVRWSSTRHRRAHTHTTPSPLGRSPCKWSTRPSRASTVEAGPALAGMASGPADLAKVDLVDLAAVARGPV